MVREKLESTIKRKEVPFVQRIFSCMIQKADLRELSEHLLYNVCSGDRVTIYQCTAMKCHKNWEHYERLQVVMSSEVGWRAARVMLSLHSQH